MHEERKKINQFSINSINLFNSVPHLSYKDINSNNIINNNNKLDINKIERRTRLSNREILLSAAVLPTTTNQDRRQSLDEYNAERWRLDQLLSNETNANAGRSDHSDRMENADEKFDENSEKEFDEDSYIRSVLENSRYDDGHDVDADCTLSEYERNILNKYLKEFTEQANDSDDNNNVNATNTNNGNVPQNDAKPQQHAERYDELLPSITPSTSSSSLQRTASTASMSNTICNSSRQMSFVESKNINKFANNSDRYCNCNNNSNNNNTNNINTDLNQTNVSDNERPNGNRHSTFGPTVPLWVGVTSCFWGLFFYFVKTYYLD